MAELQRISRIILELEPLAHLYERHGTELFKVCFELLAECRALMCFELLAECRALKSGLLEDQLSELKLSDVYRRTFTGTFVGARKALLEMAPDDDS